MQSVYSTAQADWANKPVFEQWLVGHLVTKLTLVVSQSSSIGHPYKIEVISNGRYSSMLAIIRRWENTYTFILNRFNIR